MKGQAVMEYLFTYGWAIFILVIVVGFLFTSGMLSPTQFISDECSFSSNFPCDFVLYNDGGEAKIKVRFTNSFPHEVKLVKFNLTTQTGETFNGFSSGGIVLRSGDRYTFEGSLNSPLDESSVHRFFGVLVYSSCFNGECGEEHQVSGRMVGKVQVTD